MKVLVNVKAMVLPVLSNKQINDGGYKDSFVMGEAIGKIITVTCGCKVCMKDAKLVLPQAIHGVWYVGKIGGGKTFGGLSLRFHKSWLIFDPKEIDYYRMTQ